MIEIRFILHCSLCISGNKNDTKSIFIDESSDCRIWKFAFLLDHNLVVAKTTRLFRSFPYGKQTKYSKITLFYRFSRNNSFFYFNKRTFFTMLNFFVMAGTSVSKSQGYLS